MESYDIAIIGGGIAGLTAGIYACRANCKTVIIEKEYCGGQLVPLQVIENYPGFESINGFELADKVKNQAVKLGCEIIYTSINSVVLSGDPKIIVTSKGEIMAKSVIIANGTTRKLLGIKGEKEYNGRGVSYCATCDGSIYKGKTVAIAGSSFATLEDCLYLSNLCEKVYLIFKENNNNDDEGDLSGLLDEIKSKENVEILSNVKPVEVGGKMRVEYIDIQSDGLTKRLNINCLFVVNGTLADNSFFAPVQIDANGFIVAGENCKTNIDGVFVAGDTRTKQLRQAITAASDGATAAIGASVYAKKKKSQSNKM